MNMLNRWSWPSRYPTSSRNSTNQVMAGYVKKIAGSGRGWIDPMCGRSSLCEFRNDIRPLTGPDQHVGDALEWLKGLSSEAYDGAVYDPPYNDSQGRKYTRLHVGKNDVKYWWEIRREISRVVRPGGTIVLLAWNSNGFPCAQKLSLCVFDHGAERNSTIITEFKRLNEQQKLSIL